MGCSGSKSAQYDLWERDKDTSNTSSNVTMSTQRKSRAVLERKAVFLGRFITKALTEASLAKLRAHIRMAKGVKTKLKLSSEGLSSGSKGGTLRKSKLQYEFTPLQDIEDLKVDERFSDVILIIVKLASGQSEILAYRLKHEEDVETFRQAFYELTGRKVLRLVPVQVVGGRNDSYYSNDSSTSSQGTNWLLQPGAGNTRQAYTLGGGGNSQQQYTLQQQPQYYQQQQSRSSSSSSHQQQQQQRSRSETRRPKLPWSRSKSTESRDTSRDWSPQQSPLRIVSPTWTEPRNPITVRAGAGWGPGGVNHDVGTQTVISHVGGDTGGYFEVKSYFHRSRVYAQRNKTLADASVQVSASTEEEPGEVEAHHDQNGNQITVSRTDSLFRRIRNLSAEVQEIQDIVDTRQAAKVQRSRTPNSMVQYTPEDQVDSNYIRSVDTMLNEKTGPASVLHASDMQTEGSTVKVKVGDYRQKRASYPLTQSIQQNHQPVSQQNHQADSSSTRNGFQQQNGFATYRSWKGGRAYQSGLSKTSTSPAVYVTPPTPEVTSPPVRDHPLFPATGPIIQGNYGRARSVVDGDYGDDIPDSSSRFPPRAKSVAGSLRLSLLPTNNTSFQSNNSHNQHQQHQYQRTGGMYATTAANGVRQRQSYPIVGATVQTPNRIYRPVERVYFPNQQAPSEIRRRAQSAPRTRHF